MPVDCSRAAAAISPTMSLTLPTMPVISVSFPATSLAVASPSPLWRTDSRMSASVLLAASFERSASDRTSSATTANPRPASPARAASTAALSASRFVWNAISLMSLMICEVPSAEARIDSIAPAICCMAPVPSAATPFADCASELACCALSADVFTMLAIDSSEDEVSSSELACSDAPDATCWLDEAISAAADETWPTEVDTWTRASCSSWAAALNACWRWA